MFYRRILEELRIWATSSNRKPLVIRGARQVGKTTLVHQFASDFGHYLYLNLELAGDRAPFENFTTIEELLQELFFLRNLKLEDKEDTLIFIDEIQEVPEALHILRYFYETEPGIPVIAAGSMLESLFDKDINYPVGRVEFKVVRPASFAEFLNALNESQAIEQLQTIPIASFAHAKLIGLYHTYALIGGMPEIVSHYAANRDLVALAPLYDSLINSYFEDVEKYATSDSQILHIRHVIRSSFSQAGKRIKFEGFGNSGYRSREMAESLRITEKALLLQLIYPVTSATLPLLPDLKKSPRLQVLDTGLLNYFAGIQKDVLQTDDLQNVYEGRMIEHLTGQELLSFQTLSLSALNFWVRQKKTSTAEVDFVYAYKGKVIPIEVKSGAAGKLKSLHLFMDQAPHDIAIRFYSGELNLTKATTESGKKYKLLSLPYYLVTQIEKYLEWMGI